MKRVNGLVIATILLLITPVAVFSCTGKHEAVDESIVQVWKSDTLEAFGVVIGDGSQVSLF